MNRQIIEEASDWFVQIGEGDADIAIRRRFHDWLARSPEHIHAYLKILPVWEDAAKLDTHANDRQALIAWARTGTNVVSLTPRSADNPCAEAVKRRPTVKYAFAATLMLSVCGWMMWILISQGTYATEVGEQRSISLEDGSKIELNSRSRLKVRFNEQARTIDLLEGQAMFQVAKDPLRPFVVRSGDTSVRAVGTQFDVYLKKSGIIVTVLEGKVAVVSAHSATSGRGDGVRSLSAGQQIIVTPSALPKPQAANIVVATAWTQQQLVFFRTPLTEVAEEFNRYNKRQLIVKGDALQAFHVSGTFSSSDPSLLIRFLQDQSGLEVKETGNEVSVGAR